jgi:hypothetical protein
MVRPTPPPSPSQELTEKAHLPVALVAVLAQEGAVLLGVQPGLEDVVAVGARGAQLAGLALEHGWAHLAVVLVGAGVPPLGLLPWVGKGAGGPVMHEPLWGCMEPGSSTTQMAAATAAAIVIHGSQQQL